MKKPGNRQKVDSNTKPEFTLEEITPDLQFGIWANVQAKAMQGFRKIEFKAFKAGIPRAFASAAVIMRCIWTSFDNVSTEENLKKSNDICVGGVVNCRLFAYPEPPRK